MKEHELEHRIKELEIELNYVKSFNFDAQKSNQSDPRFRNLIEQSIYPILLLKGENMILDIANAPLLKIFRIGKEALGKPFLEIVPEMKDPPFMGLLLDVLHNHTSHYVKEQPAYFVSKNGEKETVYFSSSLVKTMPFRARIYLLHIYVNFAG